MCGQRNVFSTACILLVAIMLLHTCDGRQGGAPLTISKLMKKLVGKGSEYDKNVSPNGENATEVKLGIYINSFHSISEQTMDYSVNIYLRQQWTDPRLAFKSFSDEAHGEIKLPLGMWNKIWVPDVTFRNEKKAQYHTVTVPNRLMRLMPNGTVWYATKISATLACQMHLWKYPFDTQTCPMMMESFGYPQRVVYFSWLPDKNVTYNEDLLSLPQFRLQTIDLDDCSLIYSTGTFSCLQANFILKRSIGYHMIQLYIPSVLIVILSWVSFWINCDAAPARVSIGLLTVLTITTQSASARSSLPRVSYVKAIDVWMSMCLLFVFASFLEFAAVNVFSRREKKTIRGPNATRVTSTDTSISVDEVKQAESDLKQVKSTHPLVSRISNVILRDPFAHQKARFIDKLSRRLFPLTFFIFLIVYWAYYGSVA